MLRTYKGRYENGKFILPEIEKEIIPDNVNIIVTILEDEPKQIDRLNIIEKIFADAQKIENELTDEEWAEFEKLRSQTNFSREVEKWFTL